MRRSAVAAATCRALMDAATTDACLDILDAAKLREPVLESLLAAIQLHLDRRAAGAFRVGAVLFSNQNGPLGQTKTAARLLKSGRSNDMVHFVGAGPGAPDLITRRGAALLQTADCIIYAGSLVNPALLGLAKPDCAIYNSAEMTLEQVLAVMRRMESSAQNHCAPAHRRPLPVRRHPGADGRAGRRRHCLR